MTDSIHNTAIKVDVYPDEFKPIMKAVKYALICDDRQSGTCSVCTGQRN